MGSANLCIIAYDLKAHFKIKFVVARRRINFLSEPQTQKLGEEKRFTFHQIHSFTLE